MTGAQDRDTAIGTGEFPPNGRSRRPEREPLVIGWMEYVDLPLLGLSNIKAKIDTGARTSAIHATEMDVFERADAPWVRFSTPKPGSVDLVRIEAPVQEHRLIKNTSGVPEDRIVIRTRFQLARRHWIIDLSLTDRSNMGFALIIGRTALKNHAIAVHTRRTLLTRPRPGTTPKGS